ncbi:mannose-1-phosphate guanylyltransferase [Planctomycetota bacterium]
MGNSNWYAIILVGGSGTRFWPMSRKSRPKQFLDIFGGTTLIETAMQRLQGFIGNENIILVANAGQQSSLKQYLPDFPAENILLEPEGRDTAAALGFACMVVEHRCPGASVAVLTSDHVISPVGKFQQTIKCAFELADEYQGIVTIGIPATYPATGFGYVNRGEPLKTIAGHRAFRVKFFREKPDAATAKEYAGSGDYYFNSGMFIATLSTMLKQFEQHMPQLYGDLAVVKKSLGTADDKKILEQVYQKIEKISFDYGVMEKCRDVFVVEADFEWDDVGSWEAYERFNSPDERDNITRGEVVTLDSSNCTVIGGEEHLIVTFGVHDMLVVHTDDATLIASKDKMADVRKVVAELQRLRKENYL